MREDLGRWRRSFPSISVQKSSTCWDLEKKRCPPISNRKSLYRAVFEIPPTYLESASKTQTERPFLARRYAAVSPAGPAPITTVSTFFSAPNSAPLSTLKPYSCIEHWRGKLIRRDPANASQQWLRSSWYPNSSRL